MSLLDRLSERLSEHFSLGEFTISAKAMPPECKSYLEKGFNPENYKALKYSATKMEKVRALLNQPVIINCGLRTVEWEHYRGRKGTSQHVTGQAIDFVCPAFGKPIDICKFLVKHQAEIEWDQIIQEHGWVHISFVENSKPRGTVLTLTDQGGYRPGL